MIILQVSPHLSNKLPKPTERVLSGRPHSEAVQTERISCGVLCFGEDDSSSEVLRFGVGGSISGVPLEVRRQHPQ